MTKPINLGEKPASWSSESMFLVANSVLKASNVVRAANAKTMAGMTASVKGMPRCVRV